VTPAPHQHLLDLIRALPPVDAQNRLLRVRDADLALSMLYMVEFQRDQVFALAGPGKSRRVREVLARLEHTRIRYDQYASTAERVIRALRTGATPDLTGGSDGSGAREAPIRSGGSYYRPTRAGRSSRTSRKY
jgi:hypothetical protein